MKSCCRLCVMVCLFAWLSGSQFARPAEEAASTSRPLPPPDMAGGKPLMRVLKERRSIRDFRPDPLTPQQLSDLLWAAFGVNRPENAHRTAPSAKNTQEIDVYVALAEGVYRYEAGSHRLQRVSDADVRTLTSGQEFARVASVALIFVTDLGRFKDTQPEDARFYAAFDAGCISQNVYLYCASAGLGTVVHDLDREPLARALNLGTGQQIIMAQAVGHTK